MTVPGQAGSSESKVSENFVSLENVYRNWRRSNSLVENFYHKPRDVIIIFFTISLNNFQGLDAAPGFNARASTDLFQAPSDFFQIQLTSSNSQALELR